jgi:hypothetical protein
VLSQDRDEQRKALAALREIYDASGSLMSVSMEAKI